MAVSFLKVVYGALTIMFENCLFGWGFEPVSMVRYRVSGFRSDTFLEALVVSYVEVHFCSLLENDQLLPCGSCR